MRCTAVLILTLLAGCGLDTSEPSIIRPFVPERGIGPWRVAALEVCDPDGCGEAVAAGLTGLDLAYDEAAGRFWVVASRTDGALYWGELQTTGEGWRLFIESTPALTPELDWQTSGLDDPDLLLDPPGGGELAVIFGVGDRSAIGMACGSRDALQAASQPLLTNVGNQIAAPSAATFGDRVVLAFTERGAEQGIMITAGPDLTSLAAPEVALVISDVERSTDGPGWGPLSSLGDPDLGATPDGLLRAFFAAYGRSLLATQDEPTAANASIGYAAAEAPGPLSPFAENPVHDRTFSYLFHADERAPSVADDGETAVMLYFESLISGSHPALAVHLLGH